MRSNKNEREKGIRIQLLFKFVSIEYTRALSEEETIGIMGVRPVPNSFLSRRVKK